MKAIILTLLKSKQPKIILKEGEGVCLVTDFAKSLGASERFAGLGTGGRCRSGLHRLSQSAAVVAQLPNSSFKAELVCTRHKE